MSTPPTDFWSEGVAPQYSQAGLLYNDPNTQYNGISGPPKTQWFEDLGEATLDTWDNATDTWDSTTDTWDSILVT